MSRNKKLNQLNDGPSGPAGKVPAEIMFEDLGNYSISPVIPEPVVVKKEEALAKKTYKPRIVDEPVIATGTVVVETLTKRGAPALQANVVAAKGTLHMGDKVSFHEIRSPLPNLSFGRTSESVWVVIKSGQADYIKLD
jgi:hypothetical protein